MAELIKDSSKVNYADLFMDILYNDPEITNKQRDVIMTLVTMIENVEYGKKFLNAIDKYKERHNMEIDSSIVDKMVYTLTSANERFKNDLRSMKSDEHSTIVKRYLTLDEKLWKNNKVEYALINRGNINKFISDNFTKMYEEVISFMITNVINPQVNNPNRILEEVATIDIKTIEESTNKFFKITLENFNNIKPVNKGKKFGGLVDEKEIILNNYFIVYKENYLVIFPYMAFDVKPLSNLFLPTKDQETLTIKINSYLLDGLKCRIDKNNCLYIKLKYDLNIENDSIYLNKDTYKINNPLESLSVGLEQGYDLSKDKLTLTGIHYYLHNNNLIETDVWKGKSKKNKNEQI